MGAGKASSLRHRELGRRRGDVFEGGKTAFAKGEYFLLSRGGYAAGNSKKKMEGGEGAQIPKGPTEGLRGPWTQGRNGPERRETSKGVEEEGMAKLKPSTVGRN